MRDSAQVTKSCLPHCQAVSQQLRDAWKSLWSIMTILFSQSVVRKPLHGKLKAFHWCPKLSKLQVFILTAFYYRNYLDSNTWNLPGWMWTAMRLPELRPHLDPSFTHEKCTYSEELKLRTQPFAHLRLSEQSLPAACEWALLQTFSHCWFSISAEISFRFSHVVINGGDNEKQARKCIFEVWSGSYSQWMSCRVTQDVPKKGLCRLRKYTRQLGDFKACNICVH